MDQRQLKQFEKTLQARRQELQQSLTRTAQESRNVQQSYGADEGDRAKSSHDKELLFLQDMQARSLLQEVEAALARIKEGIFGECVNCGQEITLRRLEVIPWSRYCIVCQELLEK